MKFFPKIALTGLFALLLMGAAAPAQAQINININTAPPVWGPAVPAGVEYYYVPEYDGYYDLRAQRYIVFRDGRWMRLASLPGYRTSSFHPVILDYRGSQPWVLIREHRVKYKPAHPHGMPPGQAKKMRGSYYAPSRVVVVDGGGRGGYYRGNEGNGRGHGNGKGHGHGKH